jgi:hypothetical protein
MHNSDCRLLAVHMAEQINRIPQAYQATEAPQFIFDLLVVNWN